MNVTNANEEWRLYDELQALLNGQITVGSQWSADRNLKLERIQALVDRIGNPERSFSHVHVGGTSGKGTVSALTAAILTAHGQRTGLHLSPWVQVVTETWQLDGRYVLPSVALPAVKEAVEAAAPIANQLPFGAASYFELKVAAGFLIFARARVDHAVIEVGLGGALDATNVLGAGVKVLTSVGLDHTEILGDTVEKIAADKVQIFKPDSHVICGVTQRSVIEVARESAESVGASIAVLGAEIEFRSRGGILSVTTAEHGIRVDVDPRLPNYEIRNFVIAIAASLQVLESLDSDATSFALRAVQLPARFEVFEERGRSIVVDGAHNDDKLEGLLSRLTQSIRYGTRIVAVVALKEGKDVAQIASDVARVADAVVVTDFSAPPWQPAPPIAIAEAFAAVDFDGDVVLAEQARALDEAMTLTSPGDTILVTGSFYLAGNLRGRWRPLEDEILHGRSFDIAR